MNPVAYFTKAVSRILADPLLKFGGLAKLALLK